MENFFDNSDEKQLFGAFQQSDINAFNCLYDRYWKLLFSIAVKKTGDTNAAEDIVQDLFVDFWKQRETLTLTTTVRTWLVSCLYFKIFHHFRTKGFQKKHYQHFQQLQDAAVAGEMPSFEGDELTNMYTVLEQAIQMMPEQMRTVFTFKHVYHKKVAVIARELSISPNTVKTHLKAGMSRLRKIGETYSLEDSICMFTLIALLNNL